MYRFSFQEYTIKVNCSNHVSEVEVFLAVTTEWPIMGVELETLGSQKNSPFILNITVEQGTSITWNVAMGKDEANLFNNVVMNQIGDTKVFISDQEDGIPVGLYLVKVIAENYVSTVTEYFNFTVDSPMINPSGRLSETEIKFDETVELTARLEEGSSIKVFFDFGDGTNETYQTGNLEDWVTLVPSFEYTVTHKYNVMPGELKPKIVISNNFRDEIIELDLVVFFDITGITLSSNSPRAYDADRGTDIKFGFEVDEFPPTLANVTFVFGDGDELHHVSFSLSDCASHKYDANGDYNVSADIYNKYSRLTIHGTVTVGLPITGLGLTLEPEHVVVGDEAKGSISMFQGDGVTISIHFGESSADEDFQRRRTGKKGHRNSIITIDILMIQVSSICSTSILNDFFYL